MNESTLKKLEFDVIRETLAGYCSTALGKRLAEALVPATKPHLVRNWLDQVREMALAAKQASLPPLGGVHDIRTEVRAAAFPTPLEADALARVAETLSATTTLRVWFSQIDDGFANLHGLGQRVDDLSVISAVIYESIDPRGEVRDYASPKLAGIRGNIEGTRGRIRAVFDHIVRQAAFTRMLQYGGATFHDDRMVLPLKAEYRGRIPGIVHRSSDSGSTLFVEPAESVELNNTIVRLRDEESKEITRILRELTQRVHLNAPAILSTLRAIAVVDLIAAKVRYARKRQAICPEITEGILDLRDARHPVLLELFDPRTVAGSDPAGAGAQTAGLHPVDGHAAAPRREVVPIDVRLGEDFDVLVITGPNTGGKTVTLKTVGLFAVMAQCGIPIPAGEGSRMPVYDEVHIDVGDEQSLQQSLSTFSSHMQNLLHILQHSGPRSLVLIDELGAGTDPDEGAAIGRTILAELLRLGAKAIVTTHLSSLKAVAFTTPRVDNASVEFDAETLRPTYHLRLGEPGNSNALIIAARLGMSPRLVMLAKEHLSGATQALNAAIAGTLGLRREAEEARKTAHAAALHSQRQKEEYEKEREELIRSQQVFERWTQWINGLGPGDDVYIKSLKRRAKVVRMQLHKQAALLSTGTMDIEVPLRDIDTPKNED